MYDRNRSFPLVVLCALALCCPSILCADTSEKVSILVDEEFTVVLEYPGTGYGSWSLASSLPSWLELVDETSIAVNPGMPGTPYTEYWLFRANGSGSTTLRFEFKNPGSGTVVSTHVCQVTATVQSEPEVISVAIGEKFTVNLSSPGFDGGYSWSLAGSLPSWLVLADKQAIPWDRNPMIHGSGVTEYWTFQATAAGSTSLTFQYMRPWEGTPVNVHVCQVTAVPPADIEKVTVATGEQFKVQLRYCVACGYEWVLAGSLPSWLELVSDEQTPDPRPPGTVGGSGTETWTFRATGSGSTSLIFQYMRPWIGTPDEVHVCQVTAVPSVDPSLVLYLPFDEGAGATVNDLSNYHNPGTIDGAGWAPGVRGKALYFASGCHITIPEIPPYDVTNAVSLLAWVKTSESPLWGRVIDKSDYQVSGFDLCLTAGGGLPRLEFFVNNTTSKVDGTTAVTDDEWHFIAGTFGNKTLRMYVDGKKEAEAQSAVNINPNDWDVMIGGIASSNGAQQYRGSIDEVAMYNRELSADEVTAIFQNGIPLSCQPEVTNIKIVRLQAAGNSFSEVGEVNEVAVGDLFTIKVEVTNRGSTPVQRPLLYQWTMSGQGHAEVVGDPRCLGLAMPPLQPGESLTLEPLCGGQAFQATTTGWTTMDITVGTCHQTFRFEIQPDATPSACQPEVTNVKIVRLQATGSSFSEVGEVSEVTVGDFFTIKVEVTNRGSIPVAVGSPYGWTMSGQGHADVVQRQLMLCAALFDLQPGESKTLIPFCGGKAFQATTAGWATMDITAGTCHQMFRFEIQPATTPSACQPEVTGVKFVRLQPVGKYFAEVGEVSEVAVGDLFTIKVQVTNRGNTPVSVGNLYGWTLSGQGHADVVQGQLMLCAALFDLQPGESATLIPFCGNAFQATTAGWVTMDITESNNCHYSITFEIVP
jgi:predicted secreted protein